MSQPGRAETAETVETAQTAETADPGGLRLDFDGAYGRTYRSSIRSSIPAYDALIEIAAAALRQAVPQARALLVVGPGPGEELGALLAALPEARLTLLEPSARMREACGCRIAALGATERCLLLDQGLEPGMPAPGGPFDAVVCHNVLHLMPPDRQLALLHTLAGLVPAAGALLLSAYSEPPPGGAHAAQLAIALMRLRLLGLPESRIEELLATRNRQVFSLDQARLEAALQAAGLEPPLLLLQALFNRLWLSRRPG